MKQKYFTKQNGVLIPCTNLSTDGYFMQGFNNPNDTGLLVTVEYISGAGARLVPVFDELGNKIIKHKFARKQFSEVQLCHHN